MTFLTFIIIAPIAFGIAYGFYRGFFKELVGIIYIVVALFAARYLGAFVADILSSIFGWSLFGNQAHIVYIDFCGNGRCSENDG